MTHLDVAHARMAEVGDDAARLRFFGAIASAELFLVLEREAAGDRIAPRVFPLEDGPVVLAFDTEARLTDAVGAAAYAALSGRALAEMLAGQGLGLVLNAGVAPSEFAMDSDAVAWLAATGATTSDEAARPVALHPPRSASKAFVTALSEGLARAEGLAEAAWLADAEYDDGARVPMLAVVDVVEGAEDAVRAVVGETVFFADGGALDVTFVESDAPVIARLERVALRFDFPEHAPAIRRDPDAPPRLR